MHATICVVEAMDRPFRTISELEVRAVGKVLAAEGDPGCRVADAAGEEFLPATDWLLQLWASDSSPHTRAGLRVVVAALPAVLVGGRLCRGTSATEVETRDFVLWARQAPKFAGKQAPAGGSPGRVNLVTGKRNQTSTYSPSTINHTLSVVLGVLPVPRRAGPRAGDQPGARGAWGRRHAHHNPDDEFDRDRRAPLRQKAVTRTPRAIPDEKFDELFRRLGGNRDRALVAFYVQQRCAGLRAARADRRHGQLRRPADRGDP